MIPEGYYLASLSVNQQLYHSKRVFRRNLAVGSLSQVSTGEASFDGYFGSARSISAIVGKYIASLSQTSTIRPCVRIAIWSDLMETTSGIYGKDTLNSGISGKDGSPLHNSS